MIVRIMSAKPTRQAAPKTGGIDSTIILMATKDPPQKPANIKNKKKGRFLWLCMIQIIEKVVKTSSTILAH